MFCVLTTVDLLMPTPVFMLISPPDLSKLCKMNQVPSLSPAAECPVHAHYFPNQHSSLQEES